MSKLSKMMLLNSGGRKVSADYEDDGRREPQEHRRDYAGTRTDEGAESKKTIRPIGFERSDAYMGGADATVPKYNEMERMPGSRAISGGAESDFTPQFDMQMAQDWTRQMQNEDGTTGPHWTIEQTNKVMEQRGVNEDPVKFWAAMNMIYSDFVNVAKKLGISNVDFYTEMACAFLDDKDISGDKLAKYYEYVVK